MVVWVRVPFAAQNSKAMNGFRKMISDNIPKIWDLALRWCHCRQYWIDTVYDNYIGRYNDDYRTLAKRNKLKADEVKRITRKMKVNGKYMPFSDTVNLENLMVEDNGLYEYWSTINKWILWFEQNYSYVTSSAKIQMECMGSSVDEAAEYINKKYNMNDIKLAKYLINSTLC